MKIAKVVPQTLSDGSIAYDVHMAVDNISSDFVGEQPVVIIACDNKSGAHHVADILNEESDNFHITSIEIG